MSAMTGCRRSGGGGDDDDDGGGRSRGDGGVGGDSAAQRQTVKVLKLVKAELETINENLAAMRTMMKTNGGQM
jgi:hypothetical protein